MKDSDQAMEKVLAGLRDAEPPAGMERRILETVQNHDVTRPRWGWLTALSPRIAATPMVYAATLAGAVILVLALPAMRHRHHAPIQSAQTIPSVPISPASPATVAESAEPRPPTTVTPPQRRSKPRKLEITDPEEALAVREMNAPSRPAPPLPLTEQEKLLVRFVRTRTPEELAAIDPAKWAAQDEQQRAEFDRFFKRFTKEQAEKKKLAQEAMNKS